MLASTDGYSRKQLFSEDSRRRSLFALLLEIGAIAFFILITDTSSFNGIKPRHDP